MPLTARIESAAAWQAPRDVAAMLGIDVEQVLAWIHAGELQAVNVAKAPRGKRPRWKISPTALDEFLARRQKQPTVPRAQRRRQTSKVTQYF